MAYTGNGAFGGLDARRAAADGAIRDMGNMSLRYSPAISNRTARRNIKNGWTDFGGAYYGERDFVVRGRKLYDGDTAVCSVSAGEKSMAVLESKLYILPDKIEYDTANRTYKHYGYSLTNKDNSKRAWVGWGYTDQQVGDFIETTFNSEFLVLHGVDFPSFPFGKGELIYIDMETADGKKSMIYRVKPENILLAYTEVGGINADVWNIRFPVGTFADVAGNPSRSVVSVKVTVRYDIPDMDGIFASDNRLWGYKGREIYCSALGNGTEWSDYDTLATSSWAATTKTGDNITAGVDLGGTPVFFAENAAYKIYGENPKEFQYARQDIIGVTKGDHKSVAVGAGYIFYLSRRGIYAWTGGVPQLISAPLGEERITDAVGGSDGAVYYLSCKQDGRQNLYVFDPMTFAWVREDDTEAVDIRLRGRDLCMVTVSGDVHLIGDVYDEIGDEESSIRYYLETADYNDGAVTQKSAKNILIQHELAGGEADVCVSYDGEPWNHVYTLYDTDGKKITSVIPLREKRYRTMRIRIEGDGEIVIYYMMRDVAPRTERTGGEKNVYK